MASLQKFKLLAMHCVASQSPTRSPRTSPLVQLRRRKTTLRMLLRRPHRRRGSTLQREQLLESSPEKKVRRHSLKDLFGTWAPDQEEEIHRSDSNAGIGRSGYGPGSSRPVWRTGFRCRLLLSRKAWRPVLLTVHE